MHHLLPDIRKAEVSGKKVFLRADTDVPLREFKVQSEKLKVDIEDDTRLKAWFPTLEYLLQHNATVVIGGKLGRPEGENYEARIKNYELSLKPVADWLATSIIHNSKFIIQKKGMGDFDAWEITPNIFLLENLQFYTQEKENDAEFAKKLASLADIYVNDAFAVSHRNHASVVGVPKLLPHFAGLRLQKEIQVLSSILESPNRPLIVIVGGAKIETKKPLVSKMLELADSVLVGGLVAGELEADNSKLTIATLNEDATDISQESIKQFINIIKTAKTVVWNGPVGKVKSLKLKVKSESDTEKGTREIAKAIVQSSAYKVVGGGDTIEFLRRMSLIDKFDFVSTGGGAMLSFLSGETLPGLEALSAKNAS